MEPIEDNKVKVSVEVDEDEFETQIDAAFRRIAREVRIPGFRPGKAPRKILQAQLGLAPGREEALRQALPEYYADAVREHDIDVVSPPEIDITAGEDEGPIAFEAVVEVRPIVSVGGYENLRVTIDRPEPTDDEIEEQIDRMRAQNAELKPVSQPAIDESFVRIDISGSQDGEELDALTASDYVYEVGAGTVVDELDDALRGAEAGAILEFTADHPDPEQPPVDFRVLVKEVNTQVLPDADDAWAAAESEFDTIDELRADLHRRAATVKRFQAQMQLRERTTDALAALVTEDIPATMLGSEVEARMQNLFQRLSAQGADLNAYFEQMGQSPEEFSAALEAEASQAIRVDLGLRALSEAEAIEADEADLDAEIERIAEQVGEKPAKVRKQLDRNDQLSLVRSDVRRRKALEWLIEHVEIVDESGEEIDRDLIDVTGAFPDDGDHDHSHDHGHDHEHDDGEDSE
ncbi:MAG TPA: trigger factor [Acidimicrobiales bacterium]|nr:trigger factor [Acidimicrobiales bacterium]